VSGADVTFVTSSSLSPHHVDTIVRLVRTGLATATSTTRKAGSQTIEVARVRITDNGRKALGDG
jgi:hypothetical protein